MNVFRVFFSVVVLNIFNVEIPRWDFYNWTAADRCSSGWNVSAPEFHSFFFPEPNRVFTELYRFHFLNFDRFSCLVVSLRTGWSNVFLLKLVLSLFFFWLDLCWNWCQKVFRYLRFWEGLATNLNEIRMVPFFFENFLERAKFPVLPFRSFVSFFFDGISRLLYVGGPWLVDEAGPISWLAGGPRDPSPATGHRVSKRITRPPTFHDFDLFFFVPLPTRIQYWKPLENLETCRDFLFSLSLETRHGPSAVRRIERPFRENPAPLDG